jgi:peptidoglycan/xylan/chitin deacetylase (PgdA/CDA1 family)
MSLVKKFVQETKTRFYQSFYNKPHRIKLDKAIISISFDDVPSSAVLYGLPVLDRFNIKATFYVATGLAPDNHPVNQQDTSEIRFLTHSEIEYLDRIGHDIACHTYSHYMLEQGNAEQMERDAVKNIQALSALIGGKPIEHFSYPFGQLSFNAKRLLSRHYKTMRSSRPGINFHNTDLYLLRAISIHNSMFNKLTISEIIKDVVDGCGWLIFYTHGVDDNPGQYDCSPKQLDWVLAEAVKSDARILPVADAYKTIMKT